MLDRLNTGGLNRPTAVAALALLVAAPAALAGWFHGNDVYYAGMAGNSGANTGGFINGVNKGEMTNENSGTPSRELSRVNSDASSGVWFSGNYGNPRQWRINFGATKNSHVFCYNGTSNPISVKCGWNTF